jgi:hypothetical protein
MRRSRPPAATPSGGQPLQLSLFDRKADEPLAEIEATLALSKPTETYLAVWASAHDPAEGQDACC